MSRFFKLTIFFIFLTLFSCQRNELKVINGMVFGTSYQIKYFSKKNINLQSKLDSLFTVFNQTFSTYDSSSLISKINQSQDTVFKINTLFQKVFNTSKSIYNSTEGYFDPTIKTLMDYWKSKEIDSIKLKEIRSNVGFQKSKLKGLMLFKPSNIQFDFNAIAKGYAVDLVHKILEKLSITDFLVEIGGEISAKGTNKNTGKTWSIGIAWPKLGSKQITRTVQLNNKAIATSGNYVKYWTNMKIGKKISHLINPISGDAQLQNTISVSVISNKCMIADAYATAFMVMPLNKVKSISKKHHILVYVIYLDENGYIKIYKSSSFNLKPS